MRQPSREKRRVYDTIVNAVLGGERKAGRELRDGEHAKVKERLRDP